MMLFLVLSCYPCPLGQDDTRDLGSSMPINLYLVRALVYCPCKYGEAMFPPPHNWSRSMIHVQARSFKVKHELEHDLDPCLLESI
ncbi:hypothetical protein AUP68_15611 [Ilyonectria robusta]